MDLYCTFLSFDPFFWIEIRFANCIFRIFTLFGLIIIILRDSQMTIIVLNLFGYLLCTFVNWPFFFSSWHLIWKLCFSYNCDFSISLPNYTDSLPLISKFSWYNQTLIFVQKRTHLSLVYKYIPKIIINSAI